MEESVVSVVGGCRSVETSYLFIKEEYPGRAGDFMNYRSYKTSTVENLLVT